MNSPRAVCQNNNIIIYSAILLPELLSSAILESTPERNQRNECCLRLACVCGLLNVNSAHYAKKNEINWFYVLKCIQMILKLWIEIWIVLGNLYFNLAPNKDILI